jgi:hypothetical protein
LLKNQYFFFLFFEEIFGTKQPFHQGVENSKDGDSKNEEQIFEKLPKDKNSFFSNEFYFAHSDKA